VRRTGGRRGALLAAPGGRAFGSERGLISVLFVDLRARGERAEALTVRREAVGA
jgi:hypothetical protein